MLHSQMIAPALVGRRGELEALEALLEGARGGHGAVALIGGDAGIGKTRLCRSLKASAAGRQVRVIEGRSSAAEAAVPYGPFMDALRFRLGRGESEAAVSVLAPVLAHVAPLFTGLVDARGAGTEAPAATSAPFEPIFRVLQRLGELGPILFILEDLHWADTTSRDLLHYIARRVAALPMLVVATYRTDEMHPGHPLHRLVGALARERAASRVHLEPLCHDEVAEMLAGMLDVACEADFVDAVCRRTEGNPLFIEELVSVLAEAHPGRGPDFLAADLDDLHLPATLHEMVWERLAPLTEDAREALTAAAVAGRRFRFDVLAGALRWDEERLLDAIERPVARRIILEDPDEAEETYSFRHSLVQEVLYGSTIGRRRRLFHRRVAGVLEAIGGSDALPHTALAHHYSLGGEPEKARAHTVLAGDEAARLCAWKDAESMYEEALAALEREGGDPAAEADILERMADVAWWQNRIPSLEQYAREALALRRELGHVRAAAMLLRRLANLDAYQHGDRAAAMAALREALDLLGDDDAERAVILNDMGRLHLAGGEFDDAAGLFERSLVLSGGRGDCAEEALSLAMLGRLAIHAGAVATGTARLQLARALLQEQAVPAERGAEVFHAGIRALDAAREHAHAGEWVDAALEYARAHGATADLAVYRACEAAVRRRAGRWESAVPLVADAVDELRGTGRAELRDALRILGDLRRGRGELQAARSCYAEAQRLGDRDAAIGDALLLMAEQRCDEAAHRLELALASAPPADRLFALRVLPLMVEAYAGAGSVDQARDALLRLRALTAASDYRPGPAALAHAAGVLHAAAGERTAALGELRTAVQAWSELELPYEAARSMVTLARELIRSADGRAEGLELAAEAAERFEALGAALDLARAHAVLREGGVRRRARRRSAVPLPAPLDRLTQREIEVLREITHGRTNKQIARTLSLSPRTVGNHVSSILGKLGCSTRTEAARMTAAATADLSAPAAAGRAG